MCPGRIILVPNERPRVSQPHLEGEYDIIEQKAVDVKRKLKDLTLSQLVVRPQELVTSVFMETSLDVRPFLPTDDHLKRLIRQWRAKAHGRKEPLTREEIELSGLTDKRGEELVIHDSGDTNRIIVFSTKSNIQGIAVNTHDFVVRKGKRKRTYEIASTSRVVLGDSQQLTQVFQSQ
ncbi:unnamed protein product [Orchesella dallaii]|uniref:Uncharacterized protein n=1 Tax=Orchesella dallaii TaxID=48710 RepID=A0ABP1RIR4_9HEXA